MKHLFFIMGIMWLIAWVAGMFSTGEQNLVYIALVLANFALYEVYNLRDNIINGRGK